MSQSNNAWAVLTDHKLECPVCMTGLEVEVLVNMTDPSVRIGSSTTFRRTLLASVIAMPKKVRINHQCEIPEDES